MELNGLQLTSEEIIDMELRDAAFVFTATADTLKRAFTGAGSGDDSLTLDQPARNMLGACSRR